MIDNVVTGLIVRLVEQTGQMAFGHGHSHGIGKSLAQRAGRRFNTDGVTEFRMSGGFAAPLSEIFNIIKGEPITGQIKQAV